jgi:hypothetical protein
MTDSEQDRGLLYAKYHEIGIKTARDRGITTLRDGCNFADGYAAMALIYEDMRTEETMTPAPTEETQ